jgi:hypothetical protein
MKEFSIYHLSRFEEFAEIWYGKLSLKICLGIQIFISVGQV